MRHFGGGVGHPRSALHLQHDDRTVFEEDVGQDTTLDEDGADDSEDGDSKMETKSSASSSADETELDTDDDGYDSL